MNRVLSAMKRFFANPHIQISLATGTSIIVMAVVSKHVLPRPIPYLQLAAPPFLMTIWEALLEKHKGAAFLKPVYWVLGIFAVTAIVIVANAR